MKKLKSLLILFFIIFSVIIPVNAESVVDVGNRPQKIVVFDNADLYTFDEENLLVSNIKNRFSHLPIDVVFLTYYGNGESIVKYTDDFYDKLVFEYNYNPNGIMFTIDMGGREVYISTSEDVVDWINDAEIQDAIDAGFNSLGNGAYYNAINLISNDALSTVEHWYVEGPRGASDYIKEVFLGTLWYLPVLVIVFIFSRKSALKKHNKANEFVTAEANIPKNHFTVKNISENFIRQYETRTKVSSSSSGSSGHRSGSSHRSSGGRRSGGGGRRF